MIFIAVIKNFKLLKLKLFQITLSSIGLERIRITHSTDDARFF